MTQSLVMIGFVLMVALCGPQVFGKPLKVYILAGQSNMQGSAHKRTVAAMEDVPETAPLLKGMLNEKGEMTKEEYQKEFAKFEFGDGEITAKEQATWDRCSSNAEYHCLGSGKTFIRFGKALAEAMLTLEKN